MLIRALGTLLGGSIMADYAAGIILANVCFYGVLVLFYQLVSKDYGHTVARYALIYLAFDPYGLFFFVGYAESLFLLLTLAVFFFLRRGRALDWWLAGLCGCLAALTRPTGDHPTCSFSRAIRAKVWDTANFHTGELATKAQCCSRYGSCSGRTAHLSELPLDHLWQSMGFSSRRDSYLATLYRISLGRNLRCYRGYQVRSCFL